MTIRTGFARSTAAALICLAIGVSSAEAGVFSRGKAAAGPDGEAVVAEFDRALSEQRLVDAGRILDAGLAAGLRDPRLMLRSGELHLARGRYEEAARSFGLAEQTQGLRAEALQGRGVALAQLGRSREAAPLLREAVALDPSLWRAWNAVGVECDRRQDWIGAEQAYAEALKAADGEAVIHNNRGYSRLLQGRLAEAAADFVAALDRDPALAPARSNLRLALALGGDYARATTAAGRDQQAAVLNNAGFAAVMRGDLDSAEDLFQRAIEAKGAAYGRAYENLAMVRALKAGGAP
ncbi:MAG: tetratricopeptide repeat protein [Phenylobacterium sp.]|uniref:tetratricopeptide repeat protein n=1 Tax=Phenylobacterium sp. TaxID=1871053 RepID=UPI00391BA6C7